MDRVERLVRYHPLDLDWPALMARLEAMNRRGAIVGPKGSGKTTLLEDLGERLAEQGFAVVWRRPRCRPQGRLTRRSGIDPLPPVTDRTILLLDSAEMLGPFAWRRLRWRMCRAGGMIINTHRPGMLPVLLRCRTTPALLARILGELVDREAEVLAPLAAELYRHHRGNVREALRAMYDRWADRRGLCAALEDQPWE